MLDIIFDFFDIGKLFLYATPFAGIIFTAGFFIKSTNPAMFQSLIAIFSKPIFWISIVALCVIGYLYYTNMNNVKKIALMEYNKVQLEENIKQQQKTIETQQKLAEDQKAITTNLAKQNENLAVKITTISNFLQADSTKKLDKQSSEILKRTIELLAKGSTK